MNWKPIVSGIWLVGIFFFVVLGIGNLLFQNWTVGLTLLGALLFWLVIGALLWVALAGFVAGEEDFYREPWSNEQLEEFENELNLGENYGP